MNAKLQRLFDIVGGFDRNGEDFLQVREAQGLVKDLQQELEAAS